MKILTDAAANPQAFIWNGPMDPLVVRAAISGSEPIPRDLVRFWEVTGGGVAFETEEFAAPYGANELVSTCSEVNAECRASGMSNEFFVFQTGAFLSAVRLNDQRFVVLGTSTFEVVGDYATFDEWYTHTLRDEFASRYF